MRILSKQCVRSFGQPRPNADEIDPVLNHLLQVGMGGMRVNARPERRVSTASVGTNPKTIYHPGAGGSIAWADPDTCLAVSICHNRMFNAPTAEHDPFVDVGNTIRKALGLPA